MDRMGSTSGGGVRTLEKKNKQLNTATKQLEEKVKSLAQKSQNQKSNVSSTGSNSNIRTTRALPKVVKVSVYLIVSSSDVFNPPLSPEMSWW